MTDATSFDLRAWMQAQEGPYEADFSDLDHIRLETDYAVAQINFYDMAPDPEIVEFHTENKADGETKSSCTSTRPSASTPAASSARW